MPLIGKRKESPHCPISGSYQEPQCNESDSLNLLVCIQNAYTKGNTDRQKIDVSLI